MRKKAASGVLIAQTVRLRFASSLAAALLDGLRIATDSDTNNMN
jgi:hypothetical protein